MIEKTPCDARHNRCIGITPESEFARIVLSFPARKGNNMQCKYCSRRSVNFAHNRNGTRRHRWLAWRKTFSEPRSDVGNLRIPFERECNAAVMLAERNSIRSTARFVGIKGNTVISLLARLGNDCAELLQERVRDIDVNHFEIDEIWTYVGTKQRRVTDDDRDTVGDAHCYIAIDRDTRLIVA